jgi:hypothetical protein
MLFYDYDNKLNEISYNDGFFETKELPQFKLDGEPEDICVLMWGEDKYISVHGKIFKNGTDDDCIIYPSKKEDSLSGKVISEMSITEVD